jgi:small subunit ribosomal protein S16
MLKIRLRRMGARHRHFYRVVVSDSRRYPGASAIEEVGHYNPHSEPQIIEIDSERVAQWVDKGAQLTPTVRRLLRRQTEAVT